MTFTPDMFDPPENHRGVHHHHACNKCGSHHYRVYPGVGPHVAQLRCAVCGLGGVWMTKAEYEELNGRPQ